MDLTFAGNTNLCFSSWICWSSRWTQTRKLLYVLQKAYNFVKVQPVRLPQCHWSAIGIFNSGTEYGNFQARRHEDGGARWGRKVPFWWRREVRHSSIHGSIANSLRWCFEFGSWARRSTCYHRLVQRMHGRSDVRINPDVLLTFV